MAKKLHVTCKVNVKCHLQKCYISKLMRIQEKSEWSQTEGMFAEISTVFYNMQR